MMIVVGSANAICGRMMPARVSIRPRLRNAFKRGSPPVTVACEQGNRTKDE